MVGQRTKSLIIEELAKRSDGRGFHVCYHFAVRYVAHTFCAVCSGHKLVRRLFDWEDASLCKLLRIKRMLVAGGRLELPTLGL